MNSFKQRRGFAAMPYDKQAAISSKGGKAAHEMGTAHTFDSLEARQAGRLGGESVSRNRDHMAEIGRRGGIARAKNVVKRRLAAEQEDAENALVTRVENGEFGKGAIIKDGKVIKSDVDATDAMEHFRDGLR